MLFTGKQDLAINVAPPKPESIAIGSIHRFLSFVGAGNQTVRFPT